MGSCILKIVDLVIFTLLLIVAVVVELLSMGHFGIMSAIAGVGLSALSKSHFLTLEATGQPVLKPLALTVFIIEALVSLGIAIYLCTVLSTLWSGFGHWGAFA